MHLWIGQLGHLAIITAFITAVAATFSYVKAAVSTDLQIVTQWNRFARQMFWIHSVAVVAVVFSLYWIIYNHYFEYHYAWDNASLALPAYYTISSFWQDQEGSFLLWIFWLMIIGNILIVQFSSKKKSIFPVNFEAPTLAVFGLVEVFLCSMILGVVLPYIELKIGSSPFLLLREANPDWPVWATKPDFIPEDGNGLNPLLQNPWMVIHPPTLFLGFALTLVPFAFCIAGLWKGEYKNWIKPALPWTALATLVLGVGIMMGAIWAYETLNFGGYWNWDPVENAVYVPWLVLVSAFHTMLIYQTNKSTLLISKILIISQFILILYSTFLTRSGILGNASVHSFTDLGLSGQLLIYLLTFVFGAIAMLVWRWKALPVSEKELSTYSKDFWIFCGATILCLAGFQVIVATSIPAYNALLGSFGVKSNLALPADQIAFYTQFQLWFFVGIVLLNGIGQFFWWGKMKPRKVVVQAVSRGFSLKLGVWEALGTPVVLTFLLAALALVGISVGKWNWVYLAVLVASVFSVVTNGSVLWQLLRSNVKLAGGAVAHVGVALMLLGVLFSAGYSKVITQNKSGLLLFQDTKKGTQENLDNQLLWLNQPQKLDDYLVTFKGKFVEGRQLSEFIPRQNVSLIEGDFRGVAETDIIQKGKTYYKKGDTLELYPENTYYQVEYRTGSGQVFSLYPRVQINPRMGNAVSPAIRKEWNRDVYTHITDAPMPNQDREWSATETFTVAMGDTIFLNDFVAIFRRVESLSSVPGVTLSEGDAAVQAVVEVLEKNGQSQELRPIYFIKDRSVGLQAATSEALGLRLKLSEIAPQTSRFTFQVNTTQREYIVMKALEKPYINLLWLGLGLVVAGLTMATVRRFKVSS